MISNKMLDMVRQHVPTLAQRWRDEVRKATHMPTYNRLPNEELVHRNEKLFQNLLKWMERGATCQEVGNYFVEVGKKRYLEGFPLCEVTFALYLDKVVFWSLLLTEGMLDTPLRIYQAMEIINYIYRFFDLGNLYMVRGYMEEMYAKIERSGKFTREELAHYIFPGSFLQGDYFFK